MDGLRRARLPGRQAPRLQRARRRRGHGRDLGRRPVHHDGRRPRLAVLAERPARRADADPLRAVRVAGRQRALPEGAAPTRRRSTWDRDDNPLNPPRDPRYPIVASTFRLTEHHTAGADEPQPAVARRAAARDVRRDRPRARGRARDRGRRLDVASTTARGGDRGAREGHPPDPAAADRRAHRAPDLAALALGHVQDQRAGLDRRHRQRPRGALAATRTSRSRTSRSRATCAPGGARSSRRTGSRSAVDDELRLERRPRRRDARQGRPDDARRRTSTPPAGRTDPSDPVALGEIAVRTPGAAADGLLHRHDGVHRLQGLRGRLQAVERPARRRLGVPQGRLLRPHRRRCRRRPGGTCASSRRSRPRRR